MKLKKYGLNLYSVRDLLADEAGFTDTALKLKEQGYSFLQFSGVEYHPDMLVRVRKATGMSFAVTHMPVDRIVGDTDKLMEEHASFGCNYIGLGSMKSDVLKNEDALKKQIEDLDRAGEKMEKNGFKFFYHNHFSEFYKYGGKTIFDMLIEAPHIHFTVDTYWLQYGGADVAAFFDRIKGRMECVHLKDYKVDLIPDENGAVHFKPIYAPLGDGTLDFEKIIPAAEAAGGEYFIVEQDNATKFADPLEQVGRSAAFLNDYIKNH